MGLWPEDPGAPKRATRDVIVLTAAEAQSGFDRVRWAELLIEQLPDMHEGRNSWLLNYGTGEIAQRLRRVQRQWQAPPWPAPMTPTLSPEAADFLRTLSSWWSDGPVASEARQFVLARLPEPADLT